MKKEKLEELKKLKEELLELGITIDIEMKISRLKSLLKEHEKVQNSTELLYEAISKSLNDNGSTEFIYYKFDEYDLYDKFYRKHYELTYLPLEDMAVYQIKDGNNLKNKELYHEKYFKKFILFNENTLLDLLRKDELEIDSKTYINYNRDAYINELNITKQKSKVKVLKEQN